MFSSLDIVFPSAFQAVDADFMCRDRFIMMGIQIIWEKNSMRRADDMLHGEGVEGHTDKKRMTSGRSIFPH